MNEIEDQQHDHGYWDDNKIYYERDNNYVDEKWAEI